MRKNFPTIDIKSSALAIKGSYEELQNQLSRLQEERRPLKVRLEEINKTITDIEELIELIQPHVYQLTRLMELGDML